MLPKVLIGLFALELATCIVVGIHMFGDEVAARRGERGAGACGGELHLGQDRRAAG